MSVVAKTGQLYSESGEKHRIESYPKNPTNFISSSLGFNLNSACFCYSIEKQNVFCFKSEKAISYHLYSARLPIQRLLSFFIIPLIMFRLFD